MLEVARHGKKKLTDRRLHWCNKAKQSWAKTNKQTVIVLLLLFLLLLLPMVLIYQPTITIAAGRWVVDCESRAVSHYVCYKSFRCVIFLCINQAVLYFISTITGRFVFALIWDGGSDVVRCSVWMFFFCSRFCSGIAYLPDHSLVYPSPVCYFFLSNLQFFILCFVFDLINSTCFDSV